MILGETQREIVDDSLAPPLVLLAQAYLLVPSDPLQKEKILFQYLEAGAGRAGRGKVNMTNVCQISKPTSFMEAMNYLKQNAFFF